PLLLSSLHAGTIPGIEFAKVDGLSLKLDLHRPDAEKPPLVVYVHGGAWRAGSRDDVPVLGLLDHGFAIASVDYRLSTQARFPAQIHDIKAAIRFLRAKAEELIIDTTRIAIIGSSAGGHLAALTGVTNDHAELEGHVGDHLDQSSRIDAIVSFYGASNLQSILGQSTEFGLGVRIPALKLLLGDVPDKQPILSKLASPVAHLDAEDPPLLLIHGDADPQMPPVQSEEFREACEKAGVPVELVTLPGAKHGGAEFYDKARLQAVADFLQRK
ncbi:MAG: alpha/beta hydrolase, partial [Verrucomicrobiales bacterium]|nr:alpha/beta hydrolase [Verrucomicrobiales bacterium]